jgi:hypothetical protein
MNHLFKRKKFVVNGSDYVGSITYTGDIVRENISAPTWKLKKS